MAAGIVLAIAGGDASAQTYGFFRYDDDFSAYTDPSVRAQHDPLGLKFIRIDGADGAVLALGADDREKVESYENPAFGLAHAPDQTVWMHRLLVHANLATSQARVFVELGHHTERGRSPTALPTDVDHADVQQAFVDVAVGPNDARITARLGRQEMSYGDGLLIGVRDGPNIRQDWDGARVFWNDATTRVDAFAVRPIGNLRGAFDDADLNGQSLWGLYVTRSSSTRAPALTIDAFYFGSIDRALHLSSGADRDRRSTWGVRLAGAAQGWDGVIEPMVQRGRFGARAVDAFAVHVEGGWTATAASGTPRLAAKFDVLSGNRHPMTCTVTGFNPLYPNLSYSTEATIEAATNLIEIGGTLTVTPARRWTVVWTVERLWRQSTADAIYVAPLIPLVPPEVGTHQRAIGNEQQLATTWRIDDRVAVKAALVQFKVGGDLRAVGARDERYVMGWISLRY